MLSSAYKQNSTATTGVLKSCIHDNPNFALPHLLGSKPKSVQWNLLPGKRTKALGEAAQLIRSTCKQGDRKMSNPLGSCC